MTARALSTAACAKRDAFLAAVAENPTLMGIVNVTPDSFSDGGRFQAPEAAIAEAHRHGAGGAAIIDVGAESTRPGYRPVPEAEEQTRLAPVLAALIDAVPVAVSIDTTKASIAALALEAGACVVNDQWGLQHDPAMAGLVATSGAALVMMHNAATIDPETDVIDRMRAFFDRSLAIAAEAGIARDAIILDPGIGFGKTTAQNLRALGAGISALRDYGLPILVGASRKSLFAALIGKTDPTERLVGTLAAHLAALDHGARIFRVHDCAEHRDAFAVRAAITHG